MRRLLLTALCLVLCLQAQANDWQKDTRLQKAVTLHLANALLDEVAQELSKQTGVAFTVDPALQEEKATLLVKDKPAWQVLEKLTILLDIRCERNGEGYHLLPDPKAMQQECATLEWERNALRRDAEKMLREWLQAAREDYLTLVAKRRAVEEEMERLEREKPPGWQDRRDALAKRNYLLSGVYLHQYLAGWCYRRYPASVWRPFWDGEVLWFSTSGEPNTLPLPPDALRWVTLLDPQPQLVHFGIRFDSQQMRLLFYLRTESAEYLRGKSIEPDFFVNEEGIRPDASLQIPLHQRWLSWCTPEEALGRDPRLKKQIHRRPVLTDPRSPATIADWLQRFVMYSGFNVVADSFRLPEPLIEQGDTLIEWLQGSPMWHAGYLRVEEDWLLFRHRRYWRLKRSEPPERLVRAMERKAQEEGISLDDYATLASHLTSEGITRLVWQECLFRFDHTPLQHAAPALRFWASLSADQKNAALQRQPLPYVSLTPAQQKMFREAMLAKLYEEPKMILFDALNNAELQPALAFVVERWREEAYTLTDERVSITAESPEELEQQRRLVPNAPNRQAQAQVEQITFYFGIDSWRSVRYSFSIRRNPVSSSSAKQEKEEPLSKFLSEK
ncbi:MAG: hypothetical protein ACP5RN_09560 [Armatimonadota bacterium]